MICVSIIAFNPALRIGLKTLLEQDEQLEVTGEYGSLDELELLTGGVDVIVIGDSNSMAGLSNPVWPAAFSRMEPVPGVLVLSNDPQAAAGLPELPLRAWGILSQEASPAELSTAVRAISEGLVAGEGTLLLSALKPVIIQDEGDAEVPGEALTPRETEVLQLLAQGLANKQIAAHLNISEHTVKFHTSSIVSKLHAFNRLEAVRTGARKGLITF